MEPNKCPNCGNIVPDGARFCMNCGQAIEVKPVNTNPPEVPGMPPVPGAAAAI
ncbi:MAG: zinc ribbon domain-containing protein, partial [Muribaculaceae bacterium]|nr:zinc ribbon domain-containing protein [Muribaculaceae bacterium]